MTNSLTLHPKFGVNPSIMLCFWCGTSTGIAMLGRNRGKEAPGQAVFDYEPCDTCKKQRSLGITMIEVVPAKAGQREIEPGHVPTGRWYVLKEDMLHTILTGTMLDSVLLHRVALIPPEVVDLLGLASSTGAPG